MVVKFYYFDVRALGEYVRQVLAYTGVDFEDVRVDRMTWDGSQEKKMAPFDKMPMVVLEDGSVLAQSSAIARYFARKGLAGADAWEEAQVDAIADEYKDFQPAYLKWGRLKAGLDKVFNIKFDEDLETTSAAIIVARDKFLPGLEKFLKASSSGFVVSSGVTWADLFITEGLASCLHFDEHFLDGHKEVEDYVKRVRSLPKLAAYLEKRPPGLVDF